MSTQAKFIQDVFSHTFIRKILECIIPLGLMIVLFHTAWNIAGVHSSTLKINFYALFVLSVLQGFLLFYESHSRIKINIIFLCSFLWILWVIISTHCITPVLWLGRKEYLLCTQVFLFSILAYRAMYYTYTKSIFMYGFLFIGGFELLVAFYQYFINPYWLPMGLKLPVYSGRSSGTFGSPNHFSAFLLLIFFPVWNGLLSTQLGLKKRVVCFIFCGFCLIGFCLAFSRGALVGLVVGLSVFPFLFKGMSLKRIHYVFFLGGSLSLLGFFAYKSFEIVRLRLHFSFFEKIDPTRIAFWKAAWCLFLDHPLVGNGAASFNVLFEKFRPNGLLHEPIWVHNEYLNVLSDYGLIGFILLFVPVFYILFLAYRLIREGKESSFLLNGIFLSLLAFGVHCIFDFNMHIPALGLAVGILFAMIVHYTKESVCFLPKKYYIGFCILVASICILYANPIYKADACYQKIQKKLDHVVSQDKITSTSPLVYREWIASLDRATLLDPYNADIWSCLALVSYYQKSVDASFLMSNGVNAGLKATQLCSVYWLYWVNYGLVLGLDGNTGGAGGAFKTALELAPYQSMAWYYYALYLSLDTSRPDITLQAINRSLFINPTNHLAKNKKEHLIKEIQEMQVSITAYP